MGEVFSLAFAACLHRALGPDTPKADLGTKQKAMPYEV